MHPIHETHTGTINLFSGGKINLLDPQVEDIHIEDIAHALSNICRFGGHSREFYSVAQHSCLVSYLVPMPYQLRALLHDASEAYLGDVIKPLKHRIALAYEPLEMLFTIAINRRFGIDLQATITAQEHIKRSDKMALEMEFEYLFGNASTYQLIKFFGTEYPKPCWPPAVAEEVFLSTFKELSV